MLWTERKYLPRKYLHSTKESYLEYIIPSQNSTLEKQTIQLKK